MIYALLFDNAEHALYDTKIRQLVDEISVSDTATNPK